MSSKLSVSKLVTDHWSTLRDGRTERPRRRDFVVHYGAPVAIAGTATLLGARLHDAEQMIAGAAVLAGFSFALAVYVFQLRLEVARDPRVPAGDPLVDLVDELFANVTYSVLAGLAVVGLAAAATSFAPPQASLGAWWTFVIAASALHYVITLLMCLKRLRIAYVRLTI